MMVFILVFLSWWVLVCRKKLMVKKVGLLLKMCVLLVVMFVVMVRDGRLCVLVVSVVMWLFYSCVLG